MATVIGSSGGCCRCPGDRTSGECGVHQFVVEVDHQRAELTHTHEVAADDVDSTRLRPRLLLARPAEKQREGLHRHLPHVLERMEEDVCSILRQVEAADVKAGWKMKR